MSLSPAASGLNSVSIPMSEGLFLMARNASHLPRNDDRKLAPPLPLAGSGFAYGIFFCRPHAIFPVLRDVSTSRPCERRDPYAVSSRFSIGADAFRNKQSQGLWVPWVHDTSATPARVLWRWE